MVILAAAGGLVTLAGARLRDLSLIVILAGLGGAAAVMLQPYRLARFQTFLDPWQDEFGTGYQLTQALIAFGRGEWWGVGLGEGMQKLFYLPEAHTDFIYAVLAEELVRLGPRRAGHARGARPAWSAPGSSSRAPGDLQPSLPTVLGAAGVSGAGEPGGQYGVLPTKGLTALPFLR